MPIPQRFLPIFLSIVCSTALIGFPARAHALASKGDAFLGYSRLGNDDFSPSTGGLNGWEGAVNIKFKPLAGIDVDLGHYGLGGNGTVPHSTTFLFGPRVTVGLGLAHVFAHALVGGEHSSDSAGYSSGALALGFGGGVDLPLTPLFGWRVAADYLAAPTSSPDGATHARFSTGIAIHF
jgi:hypothetical protein